MTKYLWWVHIVDKTTSEIIWEQKFVGGNQASVLMKIARESGISEEKLDECHILMHCCGQIPGVKKKCSRTAESWRDVVNDVIIADDDDDE